jgi:AcrR family transcriptional regulator
MVVRTSTARGEATRARLLDAAMSLFAEKGYEATSVGNIESAAGLAPRSGALYQHFRGKEEVLHAAVERQLEAIDEFPSVMDMLPLGDLRAELTLLARWNLASLERRSDLTRFLWREGDRLSASLRKRLYRRLVAAPYEAITAWLRQRTEQAGVEGVDHEALALVMVESMSAYRGMRAIFGRVPGDVDDERLVETWVEVALAYACARGIERAPAAPGPAQAP